MARCPWCSTPLADPDVPSCPSCGASLRGTAGEEIPGLTAVDPLVAVRSRPAPQRSRLIGWLAGDMPDIPDPAPARAGSGAVLVVDDERSSLEPPSPEVRLEMLRLEREALEAEAALRGVPEVGAEASPDSEAGSADERTAAEDQSASAAVESPAVPAAAVPEPEVASSGTRRRPAKGRARGS